MKDEERFLAACLQTLLSGTDYVDFDRVALNVLTTPSRWIRTLQLADVVTSCTTAFLSGEDRFSPPVFEAVRPLMAASLGRIGGVGLKLHPDGRYANLYHWLVDDEVFVRYPTGTPLPLGTYGLREGAA